MMERVVANRYQIRGTLGVGGSCEVFEADQKDLGRRVAIKMLRPSLAQDATERARFLREARTCASLRHPNILEIYEVGEHEGRPFLTMPFVEGESLASKVRDGLGLEEGVKIVAQVAEALAFAHERNFLHRDLKPGNIMVTREGTALVVDWGLARTIDDTERLTKTGMVVGTPEYMAPEQVLDGTLTESTDLYSLGIILFEVVTGSPPFSGGAVGKILRSHVTEDIPAVKTAVPAIPDALDDLVAELTARYPDSRPSSAKDVALRLRHIVSTLAQPQQRGRPLQKTRKGQSLTSQGETIRSTAAEPKGAPAGAGRPRRRALAASLCAACVLGLVLFLGPWNEETPFFRVKSVRLSASDRVEIVFEGTLPDEVRAEYMPADGEVHRAGLPETHALDLTAVRPLQGRAQVLMVTLSPPLTRPATVKFLTDRPSGGSPLVRLWNLRPGPFVEKTLALVDGVAGPSLGRLLDRLDRLRVRAARERDRAGPEGSLEPFREEIGSVLKEFGFSARRVEEVGKLLSALARRKICSSSEFAKRLTPLCYVEMVLANPDGLDCPFGAVSKHVGIAIEPYRTGLLEPEGWRQIMVKRPRMAEGWTAFPGLSPDFYWLGPRGRVQTTAISKVITSEIRGLAQNDGQTKKWSKLPARYPIHFTLPPAAARDWPPTEAVLDIVLHRFDRNVVLWVCVEGSPDVAVVNTCRLHFSDLEDQDVPVVCASLRLDAVRLGEKPPSVTIEADSAPHDKSLNLVGIGTVSLRVPACQDDGE